MKQTRAILLTTCVTLSAATALAVPKTYEIGAFSSVTSYSGDRGLRIETSLSDALAGHVFSLEDGLSHTISFFDIWTVESAVNTDDKAPRPILATLDFATPDQDAVFEGVTFGGTIRWVHRNENQFAKVEWDGPVMISIPGDRRFSVELSDQIFNYGFLGLGSQVATIEATVKQLESEAITRVSESSNSLLLLGGGLLGLVIFNPRRGLYCGRAQAHRAG